MSQNHTRTIGALSVAYLKRTMRDKVALFFTFLFPLMFLLVFGALNRGDRGITFDVALINRSNTEFATNFVTEAKENEVLQIDESVTNFEEATDLMGRGELDSILELPENFGELTENGVPTGNLVVYYEEASPESGQTLAAVMQGIFEELNKELTQVTPPFTVEARSTSTDNLNSFDYVFAGLIGFSIMSLGIFGLANGFPAEKKTGAFRRLRAAPMSAFHLVVANAINYLIIGLLSVVLMVVASLIIFDFNMRGDYFSLTAFTLISIICMFGFGLAIGGWAKDEMQAAPLTNLVAFPLMFLSGVFFPRFLMPEWLQGITTYLPLSPIVDGLRGITAEGETLFQQGPELLIIAVWTVVIYAIAIKLFRWE